MEKEKYFEFELHLFDLCVNFDSSSIFYDVFEEIFGVVQKKCVKR